MMGKGMGIFVVIIILIGYFMYTHPGEINLLGKNSNNTNNVSESVVPSTETIKIANWNLQIFGDTKASKPELMNFYASTIDNYDIVFVQEIRDADGSSFDSLCSMLPSYDCQISSRAGRTSSKEQYGIIYKKGIKTTIKDFNPDTQDRWERPPIKATFDLNGYNLTAYNIHIKPDDANQEIRYLENVAEDNGNVIILGDLNADCDYYKTPPVDFQSWNWVIGDNRDTTSSSTDCAYDRIILNDGAYKEYSNYGVYSEGITSNVSDHYLVWVELKK